MSDKPAIYLEKDGPIGWLVLNQPAKRNALSKAMWAAIPDLLEEAANDKSICVVVVRGIDERGRARGVALGEVAAATASGGGAARSRISAAARTSATQSAR